MSRPEATTRAGYPASDVAPPRRSEVVGGLAVLACGCATQPGAAPARHCVVPYAGIAALGAYGFVTTLQPDANFGRILAAYGGVFVAGSLAWAMLVDAFRPDRYDIVGALICLVGVTIIMYAPRS